LVVCGVLRKVCMLCFVFALVVPIIAGSEVVLCVY
jgi:hypothetical protein